MALLGPKDNLFISSKSGKGSKFGFIILKKSKGTVNKNSKKFLKSKSREEEIKHFKRKSARTPTEIIRKLIEDDDALTVSIERKSSNSYKNQTFSSWNSESNPIDEFFQNNEEYYDTDRPKNLKLMKNLSKNLDQINKTNSSENLYQKRKFYNILIVDDNMFNILIINSYLESCIDYKINIITAFNGLIALENFMKFNKKKSVKNIDIIIMDCEMPIMNGFESSLKIKKLVEEKSYVDSTIIGYTALSGEEEEEKCKFNKMDGYIIKPATKDYFCQYISEMISNFQKNPNE